MNNLFLEMGHSSINKDEEKICGDFYTIVKEDDLITIVMSDGLGSGVKANILATLTAKILSTLLSKNLSMEESVYTMARTLPVCKERKLAYATFSVIQIKENQARFVQYDDPKIIVLRKGKNYKYSSTRTFIEDKEIYESTITIQKNDVIVVFSDGVVHAGIGKLTKNGWSRDEIIKHLERNYSEDMSSQKIAANIMNACMALNMNNADDDTTVLAFKVMERQAVNIIIGPPKNMEDDNKILKLFFSKEGKHVVCGGTTAKMVSKYLNKHLTVVANPETDGEIPSIAVIEGVDLVTEGIITLGKVVELSKLYLIDSSISLKLDGKKDGASLIAKMIFEEATDVNLFFGQAANEGNGDAGTDIDFNAKCKLISNLEKNLIEMGKKVKISKC